MAPVLYSLWALSLLTGILVGINQFANWMSETVAFRTQDYLSDIGPLEYYSNAVQPLLSGLSGALFGAGIAAFISDPLGTKASYTALTCFLLALACIACLPILYKYYSRPHSQSWGLPIRVSETIRDPTNDTLDALTDEILRQSQAVETRPSRRFLLSALFPPVIATVAASGYYSILDEAGATFKTWPLLPVLFAFFTIPWAICGVTLWMRRAFRMNSLKHHQVLLDRIATVKQA